MQPPTQFPRVLNRDGTFNSNRLGVEKRAFDDVYHSLLMISWPKLIASLVGIYFFTNLLFAIAYYLCGKNSIAGLETVEGLDYFAELFFFSVQTLATIGYGKMFPVSFTAHLVVTLEALVGLFGLALATGLLFARFARPSARVRFSRVAIITQFRGKPALIFRLANERTNQLVEAQLSVVVVKTETTEGKTYRMIRDLNLMRNRTPIFANTWTVIHPITEDSPFHNQTRETLFKEEMEVMVSLLGTDDIFSQTVHARFSYTPDEIEFNVEFEDMLNWKSGAATIDLRKIDLIKR